MSRFFMSSRFVPALAIIGIASLAACDGSPTSPADAPALKRSSLTPCVIDPCAIVVAPPVMQVPLPVGVEPSLSRRGGSGREAEVRHENEPGDLRHGRGRDDGPNHR